MFVTHCWLDILKSTIFETKKLFELRQKCILDNQDRRNFVRNYHKDKPLYNPDEPTERIRDLLQKKKELRD